MFTPIDYADHQLWTKIWAIGQEKVPVAEFSIFPDRRKTKGFVQTVHENRVFFKFWNTGYWDVFLANSSHLKKFKIARHVFE